MIDYALRSLSKKAASRLGVKQEQIRKRRKKFQARTAREPSAIRLISCLVSFQAVQNVLRSRKVLQVKKTVISAAKKIRL